MEKGFAMMLKRESWGVVPWKKEALLHCEKCRRCRSWERVRVKVKVEDKRPWHGTKQCGD